MTDADANTNTTLADRLQQVRALQNCDGVIQHIPYARYLGITAERLNEAKTAGGDYRFSLPFQEKLIGNAALPALHGGVIAGFAETAALLAVLMNERTQQRIPKAIDFSIDYVRSAGAQATYADCTIVRQGLSVALVQVNAWQQKPERIVATARVHFLLDDSFMAPNSPEFP